MCAVSVHPDGTWVAASQFSGTAIWPLEERAARTLVGHEGRIVDLAFAPDGGWLASNSFDGTLRLWTLAGDPPLPARVLVGGGRGSFAGYPQELEASADGRFLATGTYPAGGVVLVSTEGEVRQLPGFAGAAARVTLSDDGRLAAAGGNSVEEAFVRIWDLATLGEVARLDAGDRKPILGALFLAGGGLLTWGDFGIRCWDVAAGSFRPLWVPDDAHAGHVIVNVRRSSADLLAFVLVAQDGSGSSAAYTLDPATGAVRHLASHGNGVARIALDASGTVVATGSADGVVRVGPATGDEPHRLLGHTGEVTAVAISPRGDWVAAGGWDGTIRLWPVPDLSRPPAHTLPLPELLEKLESQTNLRAVSDPAATGGYRLVPGPFPGWAEVPTWEP
jgi:WD40 repeat protein